MWSLGPHADNPEWNVADTDFSINLVEVVQTVEGPYAVGGGGVLVANRGDDSTSHEWEVVLDDGPSASDNALRAMDVTDDGERIWFAGSSGAMACYDVKQRKKFSYSYPKEMTSTWEGIAVSGQRGNEKVLAANSSGVVLPFEIDGFEAEWGKAEKPVGRAASVSALAATSEGIGYAVDTSGNAFKTTAEEGWEDIGIVNAQVKFYDIYADAQGRVYVAAGDGRLYRYDDSYNDWTPVGVAEGTPLRAIGVHPHHDSDKVEMVVLGNDGTIYQRAGDERWRRLRPQVNADLFDLALGHPDLAVGENGTVIYRERDNTDETSKDGDNFEGRGERYDNDSDDGSTSGSTGSGGSSDPDDTDDTDDADSNDSSDSEDTDSTDGSTSGDSTSGDSTSDSTSGDSTSGDSTSDDSTTEDSTSDDSTSDSTSGDSTSGDSTSDDSTSDDSTSDDSTSDDSTSDDSTSDGSSSGDEKELEIEADYEDGTIYLVIDIQN